MFLRSAPLLNGKSPAELLMGRRLNTVIPVLPKTLQPRAVDQDAVRKKETAAKQKQSTSFNQRHRAKEQPRIEIGTEVFIRDRNKYGLVTQHSHNPRSVFVEEDGGTILRRNRSALVPTPPQQTEASTVPTTTRSGRIVKPIEKVRSIMLLEGGLVCPFFKISNELTANNVSLTTNSEVDTS
ncbi:hypothetical protein CAPTEDRAFT_211701 [Capitella teleta]|uniref:Uncharacterized protein n=1 Tax=Capitella teleta TaxID=283909 RepID=R7TBL7_CAPTE|nr:hypothetical protein CAPTEDRAFT_211701 [Capitella teleta]|eukprot:ELT91109.1 hypothetical protein CAPTEDRAFT_211701 [Capitella teleta]